MPPQGIRNRLPNNFMGYIFGGEFWMSGWVYSICWGVHLWGGLLLFEQAIRIP